MRYQVLLYFLKPYKLLCGGIILVTLGASALESLSVVAFFPLFSSLLGNSQEEAGGLPGFMDGLVRHLPIANPIVAASVLLVVIFLTKTLLNLLRDVLTAYASAKILYSVKRRIMDRYAGAHYQFHLDSKQGELLYNSFEAPGSVALFVTVGMRMVTSLLKVLSITVVLVSILPLAALAVAALGVGYYGGINYLSRKVSYRLGVRRGKVGTEQLVIANEFFSGFRQIIACNAVKRWVVRFDRENRELGELIMQDAAWLAMPRPILELSTLALMLGIILILWFSGPNTIAQSLPTAGVFAVALAQLLPPLTTIGSARMGMMASLPIVELVYRAITGPVPMRKDGNRALESFQRAIAFENVSFGYPGRDILLKRVNLTFEKGKVTALVGPSGVGKTTIINLVLGLFEPTEGRITIDGLPLPELRQATWLDKIGFVSQDPFIYHSTVADNILFGRNEHSVEAVVTAAEIANANGFICELPQGYDTIVGEKGMKLSGGQQQRVAIARAVLDSPEILIFDEATSSLDTISEKQVQNAIEKASENRTVIIVAHRLSTIRHADKIIVIEDGRVVEEGSHQELLDRRGQYSQLVAASR